MREGVIKGSHRLVKMVGIDAYRKAGGKVIENLFSDNDEDELLVANAELLTRLAEAKLQEDVEKNRAGLKGAEPVVDPKGFTHEVFPYDTWTSTPWPEDDAPEDALVGHSVLVTVNHDGTIGYSNPYRPLKEKATAAGTKSKATAKTKPIYNQALRTDLANIWTGGVQRQVARNWPKTWDLALFMLCVEQSGTPIYGLPTRLQAKGQWLTDEPPADPGLPFGQPGGTGYDKDFDLAVAYRQFHELPLEIKQQAAAQAAAQLLVARQPGRSKLLDDLARDMDMTEYWIPDAKSFWSRVSKTVALQVLRKAGVPKDKLPDKTLPKNKLAEACEELAKEYKLVIPEHRVPEPEPTAEAEEEAAEPVPESQDG